MNYFDPRTGKPLPLYPVYMAPAPEVAEPKTGELLKRGIQFAAIAIILLLVGSILIWLGITKVFGGKESTFIGPVLIGIAILLLLWSMRQFLLAKARNASKKYRPQNRKQINKDQHKRRNSV